MLQETDDDVTTTPESNSSNDVNKVDQSAATTTAADADDDVTRPVFKLALSNVGLFPLLPLGVPGTWLARGQFSGTGAWSSRLIR